MASYPLLPAKPPRVTHETAARAVDALLKWLRSKPAADSDLHLVLTLKKIPHRGRPFSFPIPIPHPTSLPISLIVDDRPSSPLSPSAALDLVRSLSLPVSHVLPLSSSSFDPSEGLFFADRRVVPLLSRKIDFKIKKKKGKKGIRKDMPVVPLNLASASWPDKLRKCVGSTTLSFQGGTCCGIKIGRAMAMEREDIVENVLAAVEGAVACVPRKWANVRAFHVKTTESLALPIYQSGEEGIEELGELERNGEGEEVLRKRKMEKMEGEEGKERKRSKMR